METYLVLLRGINVGGKNKVPMAELRSMLSSLGFENVATYIASGNAIVSTKKSPAAVAKAIEEALPLHFALDSDLVRVKVVTREELRTVYDARPAGFGDEPEIYNCDVIFLLDISPEAALAVFCPREGVDTVWPGPGVIYSQRLSAERTKSRLNKAISSPLYKSMTIRNWNTTTKLLGMLEE